MHRFSPEECFLLSLGDEFHWAIGDNFSYLEYHWGVLVVLILDNSIKWLSNSYVYFPFIFQTELEKDILKFFTLEL